GEDDGDSKNRAPEAIVQANGDRQPHHEGGVGARQPAGVDQAAPGDLPLQHREEDHLQRLGEKPGEYGADEGTVCQESSRHGDGGVDSVGDDGGNERSPIISAARRGVNYAGPRSTWLLDTAPSPV